MKRVLMIIGIIFCLYVFAAPALAAPVIDFGTGFAGSGGSLTYDGTNVTGTGIPLDVLLVTGAPQNNGVYDLSGGFAGTINSAAELEFNTTTGNITVTGGVQSFNIPDGTVLLSGTIDSFQVYQSGSILAISELKGSDVKDEDLLAALGLNSATPFTFLGFNISSKNEDGVYVANSTDILNTPVPIPSAFLLLGGGLAGLAVIKRRMRA